MSYFQAVNFITNYPDFFSTREEAEAQRLKNKADALSQDIFEVNVVSVSVANGITTMQRVDLATVRSVDSPEDPVSYRLLNPLTGKYSENLRTRGDIDSRVTEIKNQIMEMGGLNSVIEVQTLPEKTF